MGRKKRKNTIKPFCYYCSRVFPDDVVLLNHQKAKHFRCDVCKKKLNTVKGLVLHMMQVHKNPLSE